MVSEACTVLLVDDEDMNIVILKHRLEKEGLKIAVARDGQEAIDWVSNNPKPSLILMDLMMPRVDGWKATSTIKEKHPEIIILAVSAKVDERMNAIEKGFDDFVPKPIDFKELICIIQKHLKDVA